MALYNERGAFVERCKLTEILERADDTISNYQEQNLDDDIISTARVGSTDNLEYVLGDCGSEMRIFPADMDYVSLYNMDDKDGKLILLLRALDYE